MAQLLSLGDVTALPTSVVSAEGADGTEAPLETLSLDDPTLVRLAVHDATRLEWSFSVPLPGSRDPRIRYEVDLDLDVPATVYAAHDPWTQLQCVTRLDGDADGLAPDASLDDLRRATVFLTQRLARAEDGLARHARLAGALPPGAPGTDLEALLRIWLDEAERVVVDARTRLSMEGLSRTERGAQGARAREVRLADEYVSTRFIDLLAGAERALTELETSRSPHLGQYVDIIEAAEDRVAAMLEGELGHRGAQGYIAPEADDVASLDAYVERASRLKKHFQEVLFLEGETIELAKRMHHWVAAAVAVLASSWAFAWQIWVSARGPALFGTRVLAIAAFAGLIYAAKDRIKEVGRTWFFGHVQRLYGQRIVRFRAPERRLPNGDVIVSARESFEQKTEWRPDALHPDSGAVVSTVLLQFHHAGAILPNAAPDAGGTRHVRFVFRYDFTPLFARLADAVRPVPVLDLKTRRLAFREGARCYRVPVRLEVSAAGAKQVVRATLVLSKRGLERVELPC